jgi:transposase InsO family protein
LQTFNIKRVHSDNGACFRNKDWLQLMAALKIKVIDSSSNNPSSRGKAERAVQQVKTIMRKMLVNAKSGTLNWEYLPFLVSKVMNQSITSRTGFRPIEMVMGKSGLSESFLELPPLFPPHHLVKNNKESIEIKTRDIEKCPPSLPKIVARKSPQKI